MGRGGGMHKMGRYAYSLVDAVAANKTFLMWMKLKGACCARSTELPSTPKKVLITALCSPRERAR